MNYFYMNDIGGITAFGTASLPGQLAAAKFPTLSYAGASNKNLHADAWWKLVERKPLPAENAQTLFGRQLDAKQIERALLEKRVYPLHALIVCNALTTEQIRGILDRPNLSKMLSIAFVTGKFIEEEELSRVLPYAGDWSWMEAFRIHQNLSDQYVHDQLLAAPASRVKNIVIWIMRVLDSRKGLTGLLLEGVVRENIHWSSNSLHWLLLALAESRFLKGDDWLKFRSILGEKPKFSQHRARILAALIGNPNTSLEGVDWARTQVDRFMRFLPAPLSTSIEGILKARDSVTDPVTRDWASPLPAGQRHTLDTLVRVGVIDNRQRRFVGEDAHADPPKPVKARLAQPGSIPARVQRSSDWVKISQWRFDANHAVTHVSKVLDEAPDGAWNAFYTLSPEWEGTIDELLNAAVNL